MEISFLVCNVLFLLLGFRNPKLRDTSLAGSLFLSFFLSFFLPSLFLSPKKHDATRKISLLCASLQSLCCFDTRRPLRLFFEKKKKRERLRSSVEGCEFLAYYSS